MESVKRNSNRKQDVEMRRLVNDSDAREKPLEILKQKISVFEKAEHAQVHANAGDEPALLGRLGLNFSHLPPEPEIHRRCGKKQRGERRVPRAVKNVARDDEKVFPELPAAKAPVKRRYDYVKNDEGERIEKHGERFRLRSR